MKGHGERDSSSTPVSPSVFGRLGSRSKFTTQSTFEGIGLFGAVFFGSLTIEESEISACDTPDEGVIANADGRRCEDGHHCSIFMCIVRRISSTLRFDSKESNAAIC